MVTLNLSQFKQFDIHVYSALWTANLQQNCTKQTLAPLFSGESLNNSVYCSIWSYVSVYLVYCENVLCWWKPHFPLGRVKILDPGHPSACVRARVLPNWSKTAATISDWGQRERGVREQCKGGEKEEVSEVLFLSFPSRVSAWMEAKKHRRIVLKGSRTQIIS